jgi:hypothetical protein
MGKNESDESTDYWNSQSRYLQEKQRHLDFVIEEVREYFVDGMQQ